MSIGESFSKAWNTASDSARQTANTIANNTNKAVEWTNETASDTADFISETASDTADYISKTASDTAEWASNKAVETEEWVTKKADDVKDWGNEKYTQTSEAIEHAYESTKEAFDDTVAATTTIICNQTLAAENYFYQEVAGKGTSLYGEGKRLFVAEDIDIEFNDEKFSKWTGGLSIKETQIVYESETGKVISDETIKTLFTDPNKAKKILLNDKDIHTIYRDILNSNKPLTIDEITNDDDWVELSEWKSFFHASKTRGNRKFVSKDGYREAVFSSDGSIDKRNEFKGTFNFFSPTEYPDSHIIADVDPYVKYGN